VEQIKILLIEQLNQRKARNASYSLRAFSRDLGIGLGSLSEAIAGKRDLSKKNLLKVFQNLDISIDQREILLNQNSVKKISKTPEEVHELMLEDQFKLISDWYYMAILNLAKIKSNKASEQWISERLGIETYQAQDALHRLQRLGLLKIEKNKIVRTAKPITTTQDLPSVAIKKHHTQNLHRAEIALHEVDIHLREFGSVVVPTNIKNISKVKELLLKTRKKAALLLEDDQATEVYTLSFQLFPLTQLTHKIKKYKKE
jgi:uncharacterized protein (TIGR02147 family)